MGAYPNTASFVGPCFAGDVLGQCDNRRRTILLRSDLTEEELRLTLLHEMCHIGTGRGYDHGPTFLRKLHRLVRLGETGLIAEDIEHMTFGL